MLMCVQQSSVKLRGRAQPNRKAKSEKPEHHNLMVNGGVGGRLRPCIWPFQFVFTTPTPTAFLFKGTVSHEEASEWWHDVRILLCSSVPEIVDDRWTPFSGM